MIQNAERDAALSYKSECAATYEKADQAGTYPS